MWYADEYFTDPLTITLAAMAPNCLGSFEFRPEGGGFSVVCGSNAYSGNAYSETGDVSE